MADTIVELCWANLEATLQGITRSNGYNIDVKEVTRGEKPWTDVRQMPCVMIVPGRESIVRYNAPLVVLRTAGFTLGLFMGTNTIDLHQKMEVLVGDVQKALAVDKTRGGYARDTREVAKSPYYIVIGQKVTVMELEYEFDYQTSGTDPTSAT